MDEPSPPSAADLGVTDIEYERIMRGLRQRDKDAVRAPDDARDLVDRDGRVEYLPPPVRGVAEPSATRRPRLRWRRLAVLGAAGLLLLVTRHGGASVDGPGYKFLDLSGAQPVTQSSCKPLPVAVYPQGGPVGAENLVREAVGILRSASGLDIKVVGAFGGYAPGWNFKTAPLLPDDPVSVSWQDAGAIAKLTDEIAGLGGSRVVTNPWGTKYLVSGTIALSRNYFASSDHAHQLAVVLHEFGHVLGLGHVENREDIMYPSVGAVTLGQGDLEGLRLAGKGPCA